MLWPFDSTAITGLARIDARHRSEQNFQTFINSAKAQRKASRRARSARKGAKK